LTPIVKLRFTIENRALIATAKIDDFDGSPRRAGSHSSPERYFFGRQSRQKMNFIIDI
jgi:hypothetical protein